MVPERRNGGNEATGVSVENRTRASRVPSLREEDTERRVFGKKSQKKTREGLNQPEYTRSALGRGVGVINEKTYDTTDGDTQGEGTFRGGPVGARALKIKKTQRKKRS